MVIFPGFRTSSLFWDMDNALAPLKKDYRIYLVETNGQPNLSDGNNPDIKEMVMVSGPMKYWKSYPLKSQLLPCIIWRACLPEAMYG